MVNIGWNQIYNMWSVRMLSAELRVYLRRFAGQSGRSVGSGVVRGLACSTSAQKIVPRGTFFVREEPEHRGEKK
jgi:hypothetical protein